MCTRPQPAIGTVLTPVLPSEHCSKMHIALLSPNCDGPDKKLKLPLPEKNYELELQKCRNYWPDVCNNRLSVFSWSTSKNLTSSGVGTVLQHSDNCRRLFGC